MTYSEISDALETKLDLKSPPIAMAFVKEPPEEIHRFDQQVPSACTFWRKAEQELFYAAAKSHYDCPVGAITMGFDLPPEVENKLMEVVTFMQEKNYLCVDEPAYLPAVPEEKNGIVYGPLSQFPIPPDLVLFWATPAQAMIFEEASGETRWNDSPGVRAFGRPACAALPMAMTESRSTLSLGCTGMRTFTGIEESRLLVVIPKDALNEKLLNSLNTTILSNQEMKSFYQTHKAMFPILS